VLPWLTHRQFVTSYTISSAIRAKINWLQWHWRKDATGELYTVCRRRFICKKIIPLNKSAVSCMLAVRWLVVRVDTLTLLTACSTASRTLGCQRPNTTWPTSKNSFQNSSICPSSYSTKTTLILVNSLSSAKPYCRRSVLDNAFVGEVWGRLRSAQKTTACVHF